MDNIECNIYLSPGLTFMLPQNLDNSNDFKEAELDFYLKQEPIIFLKREAIYLTI